MQEQNKEFEKFITGFTAGEGYFSLNKQSRKWNTFNTNFGIKLNIDDRKIPEKIKQYFGCGNIYIHKDKSGTRGDSIRWVVANRKDLINIIIPFFERNSMYSCKKQEVFDKWKIAVKMISKGEHRDKEKLKLINAIMDNFNLKSKGKNNKRGK